MDVVLILLRDLKVPKKENDLLQMLYLSGVKKAKSVRNSLQSIYDEIGVILNQTNVEHEEEEEKKASNANDTGFDRNDIIYYEKLLVNCMKEQILQMVGKKAAEWNTINKAYKGHCCGEIPKFKYKLENWMQLMSYNEWHKECGQNTYNWRWFHIHFDHSNWYSMKLHLDKDVLSLFESVRGPDKYDNDAVIQFSNNSWLWIESVMKAVCINDKWVIDYDLKREDVCIANSGCDITEFVNGGIIDIGIKIQLKSPFYSTRDCVLRVQPRMLYNE